MKELSPGVKLFDRYQVLSTIGRGGMGYVYKVFDEKNESVLALKLLIPKNANSERSVQRFKKEFSVMQSLSHPNIVQAYEFHEDSKQGFAFSMEYIEGQDLDSIIYSETSFLSITSVINILEQIASGLHYAHKEGTFHRDLKPANILITKDENHNYHAKITDFGLAQEETEGTDLTKSSNQVGTAYYMSPEQHRGEALSIHTDIYSFGILAFELCTRKKPFDGETPFSLFLAHVAKAAPKPRTINPELPRWLSVMIEICVEKEKKHRYQSMDEVLREIQSNKNVQKKGFLSRLPFLVTDYFMCSWGAAYFFTFCFFFACGYIFVDMMVELQLKKYESVSSVSSSRSI